MSQIPPLEIFKIVEIEINALCNRRCSYCPVSILPLPAAPKFMDWHLFCRIIEELRAMEFVGTLSYHFYNEPLLNPALDKMSFWVRKKLPDVFQLLYTNGDLLDDIRYKNLVRSGISFFIVTRHDNSDFPERPRQKVVKARDLILSNRGGLMRNVDDLASSISLPCYAPSDMLIVTVTGDVLLCFDDAARTQVMGNVVERSIGAIWTTERFRSARQALREGRRKEASEICAVCSNRECTAPGENYYSELVELYRPVPREPRQTQR